MLLQGAKSCFSDAVDDELQGSPAFPYGGFAAQLDQHAFAQPQPHAAGAEGIQRALQLAVRVFEGEVDMPAAGCFAGADFADDALLADVDFDGLFQAADQLCDAKDHTIDNWQLTIDNW